MDQPPVITFELRSLRGAGDQPRPTRRTTARVRGIRCQLECTACGDKATARDPKLARAAARVHARTAHDGARAEVRSVPGVGA